MSQNEDVKRIGVQYPCAEIEVRTAGELAVVPIGKSGLSNGLAQGFDSIFQLMIKNGFDSMLFKDDVWVEITRLQNQDSTFTIKQGWPSTGHLTQTVQWVPKQIDITPIRETIERPKPQDLQEHNFAALSPHFCSAFGVEAPYVAGAMAGGIASVDMVSALCREGLLSFFGAGGLPIEQVNVALQRLSKETGVWGCNLLHNPTEPSIEEQTVDLFLQYGVSVISASAYMRLSKALVRYRVTGLNEQNGKVQVGHKIFAKVSHPSVVKQFLAPAPKNIVDELVAEGVLSSEQAAWSQMVPMADSITVEADSGGHTDSRPLSVILPTILQLRDVAQEHYGYRKPIFVGAAGGIATPLAMKGALAMGAEYVLLGSIHQVTVEAGTSDLVKDMLSKMDVTDCGIGIAPDMFEIGAHVQVLKKGTMYAQRSQKLYALYKQYASLEELPPNEIQRLEKQLFQQSIHQVWADTQAYWQRDPVQLERAQRDPKHRMALVFRWYLGNSSRWAREGDSARKKDFQIWCGPSLGAYNQLVKGTSLQDWRSRDVVTVARTLLIELSRMV